jgi:hypothetical protein
VTCDHSHKINRRGKHDEVDATVLRDAMSQPHHHW